MTDFRNRWAKWSRMIAVAAMIGPLLCLLAPAAETTKNASKGDFKAKKAAKKARQELARLKASSDPTRKEAEPGRRPSSLPGPRRWSRSRR